MYIKTSKNYENLEIILISVTKTSKNYENFKKKDLDVLGRDSRARAQKLILFRPNR